jgi:hypothetical protein
MTKNKKYSTDFLFPSTSFFTGMGSVFNIGGNYFQFKYSSSSRNTDAMAIVGDWNMIGRDLYASKNQIEQNLK